MNKQELLQLNIVELTNALNKAIRGLTIKSIYQNDIRSEMIDAIKNLFDDSIKIVSTKTNKSKVELRFDAIAIIFSIKTKLKLGKKKVYTFIKFKFNRLEVKLYYPCFYLEDKNLYKVISSGSCIKYLYINIDNTEKIINTISTDILITKMKERYKWDDIKQEFVLRASQDKIKTYGSKITQQLWDEILQKTEEENSGLIDISIKEMFRVIT